MLPAFAAQERVRRCLCSLLCSPPSRWLVLDLIVLLSLQGAAGGQGKDCIRQERQRGDPRVLCCVWRTLGSLLPLLRADAPAVVRCVSQELEKLKKDLQEKMDGHRTLEELLKYKPKLDKVAAVTGFNSIALFCARLDFLAPSARIYELWRALQIPSRKNWRRARPNSMMPRRST